MPQPTACERTLDAMCGQLLAQMRTSGHCPPRAAGGGSGSDGAIIGDLRYPLVAFRLELAAGIPAGYSAVAAAATRTTAWFAGSLMMVRGELCSLIAKCRTQQPKFSRCKQGRNSQDQSPERKHKPTVLWSTKMQARASGDRRTRALEVVMTGYFREATEINRHFIHACSRGPLGMVHIVRGFHLALGSSLPWRPQQPPVRGARQSGSMALSCRDGWGACSICC